MLGDRNPIWLINSKDSNKRKTQPGSSKTADQAKASGSKSSRDANAEEEAVNRRHEAGMCYLRGLCYAKQNAFDRAKECYKDAVRIDVQCFEAFNQLTKNKLLSVEEEWDFLQSLDFESIQAGSDDPSAQDEVANYVQMLYSTRLSKYQNQGAFNTAYESLATFYKLKDNADLLLSRADEFYTQARYKQALDITTAILADDKYNFSVYPMHLACLFELREKNLLFLIAHELAESHPDEPCTWLAVGTYYFLMDKIPEARRYFSKASMMDAQFAPAWIGFAHTFAAEGEHDQAISAYSTAARLFMGTHLPQVFLGMQHHQMNNMTVAEEFLKTAYELCKTDPILLNEMGIVYYHQNRIKDAVGMFSKALDIAQDLGSDPQAWMQPRTNLGHAYRRLKMYKPALQQFDEVLREGGKDAAIFCAKGLVYLDLKKPEEAVNVLHEALAIHPQDPIATEILNKALDESSGRIPGDIDEETEAAFDKEMEKRKLDAKVKLTSKLTGSELKKKAKGKEAAGPSNVGESSMMEMTDDD